MPAADYHPGGIYWLHVQNVMNICACSRLRAVSALKSCGNDVVAAVASLKEMEADEHSTRKAPSDGPIPQAAGDERTAPSPPALFARSAPSATPSLSSSPAPYASPSPAPSPRPAPSPGPAQSPRPASVGHIANLQNHAPMEEPGARSVSKAAMAREDSLAAQLQELQVQDSPPPYHAPVPIGPGVGSAPIILTSAAFPPQSQEPWNFQLPEVLLDDSEDDFVIEEGKAKPFSARRLLSILQHGMPLTHLQHYLSFFSISVLRERINEYVCGYPAIFYVVATNDPALLRTWVESGGQVNAMEPFHHIPLLAFATLMACASALDSTKVVVELLSLGANVSCIPDVFFSPYIDDPVDKLPLSSGSQLSTDPKTSWCVEWIHHVFAREVNLTQRYFLEKATKDKGPTDRQLQVAQAHRATALLGVSSFLIGQRSAARTVTQKLLAHMALPSYKPLVMVFAGPSGHGKTELARRMGGLLSLEIECVDCTELKHETDLFGSKRPFFGYETGSPLNNFLSRMSGKRCIVFLDEFEKTTAEVRNSLLIPLDEGRYVDRRNRSPIDCSNTIWVMATNAVDHIILDFCDSHKEIFVDDDPMQQSQLADEMSVRMKKQLKTDFGNPLTGRLTGVIPFLPFTPDEAAVVTHKYILELKNRVRQRVSSSGRQLVGNIILDIRRDGAICGILASEGYDSDQGARSLKAAVDSRVEAELVKAYLEEDGQIQDQQPLVRYAVDITRAGMVSVFKAIE